MPACEDTKEQYIEGWIESEKRGSSPNYEDPNIDIEFCYWQQAAIAWIPRPSRSTERHMSAGASRSICNLVAEQKVSTQLSFSGFSGHEEPN